LGLVEEPYLKCIETLAALSLLASLAVAQAPPLVAQNAWVRATPGADVAAAYLTLRNVSSQAVTVTGVESPIAGHAMIHETTVQGGQSRMRPHEQLVVAPGTTVKFEPGGLHVMLHDLKQPLTVGQNVPLLITMAGGGTLQVTAAVRPLSAE
jgi:copper(I)-binding protein